MFGVFLDQGSLDIGDLDYTSLEDSLPKWQMYEKTSPAEVLDRVRDATVVISNKVMLDASVLEQCKNLKLICIAATGTNNVDLDAARRLGITVSNVRAYGTPSVAQHVFTLILALSTQLLKYDQDIRNGRWQKHDQFCFMDHPIRELSGKTLGIVGYGELGKGVAKVASGFDMEVLIAQRPGGEAQEGRLPLQELLPKVDVLSLHCPLTPETTNLISEDEFNLMKDDALLINTARGGIVDESALVAALKQGRLGGAGMDVVMVEPPVDGNILLEEGIPNLIVTPHIAWASNESRQRLLNQVVDNITGYLQNQPRNVVC
ncbi:MAG: 2-hydroxyacid dehydrogenase [Gammaproteobacteria bacterium]|nr:2-hydroxyacid dehydrogenase [Gammaproteobacteria bacterium]